MKKRDEKQELSCSFCGKSQDEVRKLIAGPTIYICDECIGLCNDIIAEQDERDAEQGAQAEPPQPPEPSRPPGPLDRDRLLDIANALRNAAVEIRRAWHATRQDMGIGGELADRIEALEEAIRKELAR